MDIKQSVDACAAVTLGKDMVFRDYAQGAFRMRGIGKGQTIKLLVIPEIRDRIRTQVSIGSGKKRADYSLNSELFLKDVMSWLVINSMKVDGIQFNLLCEQSAGNIWRKRSFKKMLNCYSEYDKQACSPDALRSLQVFRERIDHEIENCVPPSLKYSVKISEYIGRHR